VPFSGKVMLNLIDIKGRRVMQIVEGNKIQGIYVERVDARFLSSGLYFLVLQMDGFVAKKKALVIK